MNEFSLQDHFLIAMPQMQDEIFMGAVIYLFEHNEDGAMGLIINKPMDVSLDDIFHELGMQTAEEEDQVAHPVIIGGPVSTEKGYVLLPQIDIKNLPDSMKDSERLCVSMHGDRHILEKIAKNQHEAFLFCLGYSGWDPVQLEQEIKNNVWLTCKADPDIIFNTPLEQRYEKALDILGINALSLSGFAGNA
jgi:putative transcriptional regulator